MAGVASTLSKNVKNYQNQDYRKLLDQCLSQGQLFRDPCFPAAPESLGAKKLDKGVEWKRPGELCSNPQFIINGATRTDICQGDAGDCWLLSAIASLTLREDLLARVIYPEQNFTKKKYAGIFHFQLWQYGEWVDVVVDDRLPTKNGKLCFMKSADEKEFWGSLLEKAYAKVNGCYENLQGGFASDAFEDFTGGIAELHMLSNSPSNLLQVMKKALSRGSMLGTFISSNTDKSEMLAKEKLVKKHSYCITGIEEVHMSGSQVQLVRLRNPWGHKEWNGAWSDDSKEWNQISPVEKAKLNSSADDGDFWMTYADYVQRYSWLEICNLTPDDPQTGDLRNYNYAQFEGMWKVGTTAGGCLDHPASFSRNPQFRVKLDIDSDGDNLCSVLVALMQKGARKAKQTGFSGFEIGFYIYTYLGKHDAHLGPEDLKKPVAQVACKRCRDRSKRFKLPLGEYVIVPVTKAPDQEDSFLLRVFYEK